MKLLALLPAWLIAIVALMPVWLPVLLLVLLGPREVYDRMEGLICAARGRDTPAPPPSPSAQP